MAGYGLASDVYSLGVTLWEVAARAEPWDEFGYGAFMAALERDCQAGQRPTIPREAPPRFGALIRACW